MSKSDTGLERPLTPPGVKWGAGAQVTHPQPPSQAKPKQHMIKSGCSGPPWQSSG